MIEAHAPLAAAGTPAFSGAALRRLLASATPSPAVAPAESSAARSLLRDDLRFFASAYLLALVFFLLLLV